jgi:hypothetical protein
VSNETVNMMLELTGVRPLLMHSATLADPLHRITRELASLTRKRDKTAADHEAIARVEWGGGLWLANGRPCIPAEAVDATFVEAARTRKKGKAAVAGFRCSAPAILQYEGPSTIEELWADERYRLRSSVTVNGKSRTIRTRPRFPEWRAMIEAECVTGLLEPDEVVALFEVAGFRIGLGDWRPKYGRFLVRRVP